MQKHEENDICDLDPNKVCDNCCKCLDRTQEFADENGYRVIVAEFNPEEESASEREQASAIAALFREAEEDGDYEELDSLDIPPELMAEWEAKLAASFREEAENTAAQPKLHGSRKKRD